LSYLAPYLSAKTSIAASAAARDRADHLVVRTARLGFELVANDLRRVCCSVATRYLDCEEAESLVAGLRWR
jgi:hypothetical protein